MTTPTPHQRADRAGSSKALRPRAVPIPTLEFPEALPVSARRAEIAQAIQAHQVVIVCGETGSGKTTQLPKIALELGRGWGAGGQGLIGHTQPRRIAASSVAQRIAQELGSPLGEVVGYKVRFHDRFQAGASIKLMTDGILLAETQSDPMLRAYDTIIIDEAHERSLNIDFLLGYLRNLLPRRPDLKVVVTSATIDAQRFSEHFASPQGPAPVITVSGRLFPVEVWWRPYEESQERGLHEALADAVDELWRQGTGDILVFLPGEREIREASDHLSKHLLQGRRGGPPAEILPLFARLSQAEQDRVFKPSLGRRIVLATNVAETSLTVPGIRFVIDTGVARVKRYSYRSKVEQLQVEPISQAAAAQRSGRCGRVADGICIRLYDEKDFASRAPFTDPEILRSSLAGVILRMKALNLGSVDEFPFLESPPRKAIADGYALLHELNAVDEQHHLTPMGRELSRLPLDPRIGRMILEGKNRHALSEVLIIASALSVQDVRDRPLEQAQAADEKHKIFDDERSEFMGLLKLWRWIEKGRGGHLGTTEAAPHHKLSHRQQEQRLRAQFVNPRRVREWRDVHSQLHTVAAEHGWRLNGAPATYEQIHQSMLAGLLGNVGCKSDDEDWYLGARGIKFWRHPGAHLSKRPGRWLVAAELVETTRLYGRGLAAIEPPWIVSVAGHLLKRHLLEPHWEKKSAEVVAFERATLYGLVVYHQRRVNFGQLDPVQAREIFIRSALVEDGWESTLPFLNHNRKLVAQIQDLEHKSRRQDVLVDSELIFAFYDQHLPAEVVSGPTLERWIKDAMRRDPHALKLSREELMRHEAAGVTSAAFPRVIRLGGVDCSVGYLHEPGNPQDGVTVTLPLYALNPASDERAQWLVPGLLKEKVQALLKSLHQKARSRLVPLQDFATQFCDTVPFAQGDLLEVLRQAVRDRTQLPVTRQDFKLEGLSAHLFMNFRLVDEHGRQLDAGRNLAHLKAHWGTQARSAFAALAALQVKEMPASIVDSGTAAVVAVSKVEAQVGPNEALIYKAWSFGVLPELMEVKRGHQVLVGFPALMDQGTHVTLEVHDDPDHATACQRSGLRRLFSLQLKEALKFLERNLPDHTRMAALYLPLGSWEELRQQVVDLSMDRSFLVEPWPTDAASFATRLEQGRSRLTLIAQEVSRQTLIILSEWSTAQKKLKDARAARGVQEDIQAQLGRLCGKFFLRDTPWEALQHFPRYLKAVVLRLDKLRADPARDEARMSELRPLEQRYMKRLADLKGVRDQRVEEFRWMIEELRVSLFAQELRTPQPVSVKRLEKVWAQMSH